MRAHVFAIAALAVVYYPHAVFPAVTNPSSVINDLADEGIDLKGAADFAADAKVNAFQAADALAQDVENFAQDVAQATNLPDHTAPGLTAGEEAAAIVGSIAASGVKIAHGALKIQSKLVAPLFKIGAKISAPIVKLKAKIAAPFALGGAFLSQPLVHTGAKLVAPTVKLAHESTKKLHKITKPIGAGIADAFSPITKATQPLDDALKPLNLAIKTGLGSINFKEQLDNIEFPELQQIENAAETINQDAQAAGVFIQTQAGRAVDNVIVNLTPNSDRSTFGEEENTERRRRDVGDMNYDTVEEVITDGDDPIFVRPREDFPGSVEMNPTGNPNAEFPRNVDEPEPEAQSVPRPDPIGSIPVSPKSQCSASLVGLETSECHRVERYQTRSCLRAVCPRGVQNLLDQIHTRCQWSATGSHCEKNCFSFEDSELGTCLDCSFTFTRLLRSNSRLCNGLADCILGSKICPRFNPFRPLEDNVDRTD